LESLSPVAAEKGVVLETSVAETDLIVSAEPGRLKQILSNLISNAITVTDSNGRVTVHVRDVNNEVVVEVKDEGPAVESEATDRIFSRCAALRSPAHCDEDGCSVLALPLTKELVEIFGGCIWAEGGEGKGKSVCFVLPKAADREGAVCATAQAPAEGR
jgi:signal transduction histidine kinase